LHILNDHPLPFLNFGLLPNPNAFAHFEHVHPGG
jgi:hypothetical protein